MVRIIAKLFAVAVALTVCLPVQPSSAGNIAYVSATGSGSACTATAPCAQIENAFSALPAGGGRIICQTPAVENSALTFSGGETDVVDCPSSTWLGPIVLYGIETEVFKFQHIDFSGLNSLAILMRAFNAVSGTVIFDDCVIEDFTGTALDIEPAAAFNLVIMNTRISNNGSGILIKPGSGGSVTATLIGVTIDGNSGGGLKTDTTNGPVSVDISNSTISNNGGNGMNAVSGAGGANMLNIKNSVIARNGSAGVQANGTNAAALIDMTLLDSNTAGATSAVNGGRMLTYGNNHIVGSAGSGFTGTAPSQ